MKPKTILVALVALLIAGGTGIMIQSWMKSQQNRYRVTAKPVAKPQGLKVLVAAKGLPTGTLIKPVHVEWRSWPKDGVNKNYIVRSKRKKAEFIGAVVRHSVAAGQPISDGSLVRPGERGFMAAVLMPGMRAVSVPVDRTTGISGFVFPGDRVDLLLTHKFQKGGGRERKVGRASETVLAGVRVLGVDQTTDDQSGKAKVAKTATIEVTPRQAEMVAVATQLGKLSLSLRSLAADANGVPVDDKPGPARRVRTFTRDVDVSVLLSRDPGRKAAVHVLRGSKVETQKLTVPK
jgi:pilus assembly protein CpaB